MAFETSDLLLQPKPIDSSGISNALSALGQMRTEQQRLKLMREQFEETRRKNAEAEQMAKLREAGDMRRAELLNQQKQQEAEAKRLTEARSALGEFTKATGEGRLQEASSMIPALSAHGWNVQLDSEDEGLPRYRITGNGLQDQQEGRSPIDINTANGPGINSTEEAFQRTGVNSPVMPPEAESMPWATPEALSTSAWLGGMRARTAGQSQEDGAPSGYGRGNPRPADSPDFTGSVPSNVVDTSAEVMRTQHQLAPALADFVGARPEALRESARSTAAGVQKLGLPAGKSAEMFNSLQESPDSTYRTQEMYKAQAAERQDARDVARQDRLDVRQEARENRAHDVSRTDFDDGWKRADKAATVRNVDDLLKRRKALTVGLFALDNPDPNDDEMASTLLNVLTESKGTQTEQDVRRALGESKASLVQVAKNFVTRWSEGGLSEEQKTAMRGVFKKAAENSERDLYGYMDNVEAQAERGNKDQAAGYRAYRDSVFDLKDVDEWKKRRDAKKGTQAAEPASEEPTADDSGLLNIGKSKLPKTLDGGGAGSPDVEKSIETWLGRSDHPAVKLLSKHFTFDPASGKLDEAVGDYISTLEADYPVEWAALEKGDTAPLERVLGGGKAAKALDILNRLEAQ